MTEKLLNLGCGSHYHKDWINIDFNSYSSDVKAHNLLNGIPLENNSVDVVYNSHVIEHFSKNSAEFFVKDCFRVLKSNGTIRMCVPDLENLVRAYLKTLERCTNGEEHAFKDYEWMMYELFDQVIRTSPGGEMFNYFKTGVTNESFIRERLGKEVDSIKKAVTNYIPPQKIKKYKLKYWKNKLKEYILKNDKKYIEEAKFRNSGELHKWMYDKYSIKLLLEKNGFSNIEFHSFNTSSILNWNEYGLDIIDSCERRPNSIYVEAKKDKDV